MHIIAYHFIALHSITCHYISFSRSNTPVFQNINPDSGFKTFLSKSNFKTWVFNQHSVICQPPGPYILKCFLRKQSGFVLNSIFNRFQFSDETHLGGVASGFLYLSKISKNFRVLVGSGLFFQSPVGSELYFSLPFYLFSEKTFQNLLFWPKFQSLSWIRTLLQESSRIRTLLQSFNRIRTLIFYSYFIHFQSNLSKSFKMSQKLRVLVKTGLCSESPSWIRTLILISILRESFKNLSIYQNCYTFIKEFQNSEVLSQSPDQIRTLPQSPDRIRTLSKIGFHTSFSLVFKSFA